MKTYLVRVEAKEHPEQWSIPIYEMEANNIEEIVEKIKNDSRGLNIISIQESKEKKMTSKNKEINLCLKSLRKVSLKKDDVIILNLKNVIPDSAVKRITEQLKETFPNNKIVVLCNGVNLSIIRKEVK